MHEFAISGAKIDYMRPALTVSDPEDALGNVNSLVKGDIKYL
ncbi:hypothetical protein [Mycobacterium sp. 852002-10029_SCH5224772]|nr:hypothetical protein [Mycobacterium sp. 852002-10029_SCH5224772]